MGRKLLYPFAGAGIGFLIAFPIVGLFGSFSRGESAAITLLVGTFLAGSGAIAGAILAGAEVLLNRKAESEAPPPESEHE